MSGFSSNYRGSPHPYANRDCQYGASCRREDCYFRHPENLRGPVRPEYSHNDRRGGRFNNADPYHSDRALRIVKTDFDRITRPNFIHSTPAGLRSLQTPPNHQITKNQHSSLMASKDSSSRDPRRASISQKSDLNSVGKTEIDKMSVPAAELNKMDLDKATLEGQQNQTEQVPKSQTSYPISKSGDSTFQRKQAEEIGKQTKAHGGDGPERPRLMESLLSKHIGSEINLQSGSMIAESSAIQEVGTEKLPSYKAISETITLRFKLSKIDDYKRQILGNLERYKNSIDKAQSKEERVIFEEKYESEKVNLQRQENELAKYNSRARTCLIELADWIAPIQQHTAEIAKHEQEMESLRRENHLFQMLAKSHQESIEAIRVEISERASSNEGTSITKDEQAKFEERLANRLVELENKIKGAESLEPRVRSICDTTDEHGVRLQDFETRLKRMETEFPRELVTLQTISSEMSEATKTLTERQTELVSRVENSTTGLNALSGLTNMNTNLLPETMDNIQARISSLEDASKEVKTVINVNNESLHTWLQTSEGSLRTLSDRSNITEKTIKEMSANIANLKLESSKIDGRQLYQAQQHQNLQLEIHRQMDGMRRDVIKLAKDIHTKMDSLYKYQSLTKHNTKGTTIPSPATTGTEIAILSPTTSRTESHTSSTGSPTFSEIGANDLVSRRLSVVEMQLVALKQRFDSFTIDHHIRGIVDLLRKLWPHPDMLSHRLGVVERQSQLLEQQIHDLNAKMEQLSTSKAEADDVKGVQIALNAATISITRNQELVDKLSTARQGQMDNERFGMQCLAFVKESTEFSELVKHMTELQCQLIHQTASVTTEEFRGIVSDSKQKLMQYEAELKEFERQFKDFERRVEQAVMEQVQKDRDRYQKIRQRFKDIDLKIKESKSPGYGSERQSSEENLMVSDDSDQDSSSSDTVVMSKSSNVYSRPEEKEPKTDSRRVSNSRASTDTRSSSSSGLGSSMLQTKKRKLA